MQIALQMVGHHRTSTINIKGVQFTRGKAMVYGADELVGNICRYLETYGAYQPHIAERKQAILDGEGDMLGIRAARRNLEKAEQQAAEARAQILKATEEVEERLKIEASEKASDAKKAAAALNPSMKEESDGTVEDKSSTEGRGSEQTASSKGSKPNKRNNG